MTTSACSYIYLPKRHPSSVIVNDRRHLIMSHNLTHLLATLNDNHLSILLQAVAKSAVSIAQLCRSGHVGTTSGTNAFGDDQLEIDVAADNLLMDNLAGTGVVRIASSEETPIERMLSPHGDFVVVFDPLDGSSIIGCNFAVGTILGIWRGSGVVGLKGCDMLVSVAVVYGPRTTMYIGHRDWGVKEVTLLKDCWIVTDSISKIEEGKMFAPANLRCTQDNDGYAKLVEYYMKNRYTLRYTGGMVPDVIQILVKRKGVFVSPVSEKAPAKLRLVYEGLPMAFLVECGGGRSSDGTGSLLNRTVKECEERTGVCVGSVGEVDRFEEYCS